MNAPHIPRERPSIIDALREFVSHPITTTLAVMVGVVYGSVAIVAIAALVARVL